MGNEHGRSTVASAELRAKVEAAIRQFHERVSDAERVTQALDAVMDMSPECELYGAIWGLVGAYKDALGEAYGIDGWLEWWWLECGLGADPMEASIGDGAPLRTIATLDNFVLLVCDDVAPVRTEPSHEH